MKSENRFPRLNRRVVLGGLLKLFIVILVVEAGTLVLKYA